MKTTIHTFDLTNFNPGKSTGIDLHEQQARFAIDGEPTEFTACNIPVEYAQTMLPPHALNKMVYCVALVGNLVAVFAATYDGIGIVFNVEA